MAKLSGLEEPVEDAAETGMEEPEAELAAGEEDEGADAEPAEADDPGPLTLSLMELQAKIERKEPQIRSFPWLRG